MPKPNCVTTSVPSSSSVMPLILPVAPPSGDVLGSVKSFFRPAASVYVQIAFVSSVMKSVCFASSQTMASGLPVPVGSNGMAVNAAPSFASALPPSFVLPPPSSLGGDESGVPASGLVEESTLLDASCGVVESGEPLSFAAPGAGVVVSSPEQATSDARAPRVTTGSARRSRRVRMGPTLKHAERDRRLTWTKTFVTGPAPSLGRVAPLSQRSPRCEIRALALWPAGRASARLRRDDPGGTVPLKSWTRRWSPLLIA